MSETTNASSDSLPRRRSRPILLVVLGVLVALLVLVAAVDVGYGMTDPLAEGSSSSVVRVCDPDTEPPDCGGTLDAGLAPGARFQYLREIRNQGVAPVTILGLEPSSDGTLEWLPPGTIPEDHRYMMGADDIVDFMPVTLAPGELLPFVLRGRVRECAPPMPEGANMVIRSLDVRYRLLAVEHVARVDTEGSVMVPFNPCPGDY